RAEGHGNCNRSRRGSQAHRFEYEEIKKGHPRMAFHFTFCNNLEACRNSFLMP
ncbi:MAG: hypothetical protein RIS42_184, partial [Bacteroidota bacterium]